MISVALAAYNGEKYIERQLNSIYIQDLPVDEVIINDDGSNDKTLEICKDFITKHNLCDSWHIYSNEKNIGYCLNFYSAISKCKGDIIFLADQDDEWLPNKTKVMSDCLKNHPEIKVLSSRYDVIDENSDVIENSKVTYLSDKNDGSIEYLTTESFLGCSYVRGFSMCFTADIKQHIKPIDLKDLMSHDWYICLLGCCFGKTAFLNRRLTHYRYHMDNVSLSAMNKEFRVRDLKKRIRGISQSIEAHTYISSIILDDKMTKKFLNFISFEKKRVKFLKNRNIFVYLSLLFDLRHYRRYYKGNGIRVYIGDFYYAYKK